MASKKNSGSRVVRTAGMEDKIIELPQFVGLTTDYERLVSSLKDAEQYLENGGNVVLDMSEVENITIDGLAYLLGNIEVLRVRFENKITGTYAENKDVNQLLIDCGFFKHLKIAEKHGSVGNDEVAHIQFRSSYYMNAELIAPLRDEVVKNKIQLPLVFEKKIFRALSEAMLNVHHHAYSSGKYRISRRFKSRAGRWWRGGQYEKSTKKLSFVMYDVGQGIPATLPRNYSPVLINQFVSTSQNCNDAELILAAAQSGKTSTEKKHRGRGIPDMHQIIEDGRGEIRIFSGYGNYSHESGHTFKENRSLDCLGTLVVWTIDVDALTIGESQNDNDED